MFQTDKLSINDTDSSLISVVTASQKSSMSTQIMTTVVVQRTPLDNVNEIDLTLINFHDMQSQISDEMDASLQERQITEKPERWLLFVLCLISVLLMIFVLASQRKPLYY